MHCRPARHVVICRFGIGLGFWPHFRLRTSRLLWFSLDLVRIWIPRLACGKPHQISTQFHKCVCVCVRVRACSLSLSLSLVCVCVCAISHVCSDGCTLICVLPCACSHWCDLMCSHSSLLSSVYSRLCAFICVLMYGPICVLSWVCFVFILSSFPLRESLLGHFDRPDSTHWLLCIRKGNLEWGGSPNHLPLWNCLATK